MRLIATLTLDFPDLCPDAAPCGADPEMGDCEKPMPCCGDEKDLPCCDASGLPLKGQSSDPVNARYAEQADLAKRARAAFGLPPDRTILALLRHSANASAVAAFLDDLLCVREEQTRGQPHRKER